jgi:hypothetical protein
MRLRWLGTAAVAVSFLLMLATLALWVRSYFRNDSIDRFRREAGGPGSYHDTHGLFSSYGSFGAGYLRMYHPTTQEWPESAHWRYNVTPAAVLPWQHRWRVLGFGYWNITIPPGPAHNGVHVAGIRIPHWFVALLFGFAPAIWARRSWLERRRRWRLRTGLCKRCGYDVRASGDRCPECGAAIALPPPR